MVYPPNNIQTNLLTPHNRHPQKPPRIPHPQNHLIHSELTTQEMKAAKSSILLFLIGMIFQSTYTLAHSLCDINEIAVAQDSLITDINSENFVYDSVDVEPQYPGGPYELLSFLAGKIKIPGCHSVQGRVIVKFVVKKDGSVGDVIVTKSLSPAVDEETIRVIRLLSGFTPAMINGEPVNAWFTVPVTYKIIS